MKVLRLKPELMTVIINIQMMNEKINKSYNPFKDFSRLELRSESELYDEQDSLINLYNDSLKTN